MPKHARLHFFDAKSVGADVPKDEPKKASLNFWLVNGECVTVAVPRYVLERLPSKIDQALKEAPLPSRAKRPSAIFPNK